MAGLGDLVISLHADTARFASDMGRAAHISEREWGKVTRSAQAVGKQVGIALTLAATAAIAMGKSAIDAGDEAFKMSQKIGMSVESFTALKYSADLSDVSIETLQQSLKKLSVGMVETQANTGEAKNSFKALGINVEATKGVLKTSEQVLFELADKFSAMEDGAGKTALAVKIFGRAGAEMIPLLNGGAEGLRKNAEEARRFGIIISTEAAKKAEEFNDNLTRVTASLKGMSYEIANFALPWLNKMVEQFLEGTRIAGGFANALRLFGLSTITSDNAGASIRGINKELDALNKRRAEVVAQGRTGLLPNFDAEIADKQKQLEFAKFLQRQAALELGKGITRDEASRFQVPKVKAPGLPDEGAIKRAEQLLEKYRDKLRGIGDEMLKLEGIDSDFLKMKSLIAGDKEFLATRGPEAEALKKNLLDAAELLDLHRDKLRQNKELEEGLAVDAKARSEASNKEIADLALLSGKYKDLADPLREITREHQKLDELVRDGWITQSVGEVNKLSAELRALLQPVKNIYDEIQKAWEAGRITTDQMQEAMLRAAGTIEKTKDAANEFGHAISTAFEDAVIGGKKAIDVVSALGKTIAQIILRQTVTKPLEKAIGGLDFGSIVKGLFSGFGGGSSGTSSAPYYGEAAVGIERVPKDGFAFLHAGETVRPASENQGVVYSPTFNVDSRTDRADIIALMRQADQQTVATIADMTRRGGGYRKAVRG